MADAPDWFVKYLQRGFHLVHYDQKKKGPDGSSALDWVKPDRRITEASQYVPDRNWGCFTGVEVQPNRYLVDVDFDWQTPQSIAIGNHLLPDTFFIFGRDSRAYSHAFFTVSNPLPRTAYQDIDKKTTIVELRGTTDDGSIGWQTMLPPSVHPSGEVVTLRRDGDICHNDALPRRIQLYAVACLLIKYLGEREFKHDLRLALSGFLLQEGITEKETVEIGEAITLATHNDIRDVRFAVRSTSIQLKQGELVKGAGALAKGIGKDEEQGREIVRQIRRYLGTQQFNENSKGRIFADDQKNIRIALEKMHVSLSYNQFSRQMFSTNSKGRQVIDESVLIPLRLYIDEQFHFRPSKDFFVDVVRHESWKATWHPVLQYLDGLVWDGLPRIDTWLETYGGAMDSPYVRAVSAIVLIAAVRRVRQPGCKYDEMLILESDKQGTGKSTALSALCPNDEWFSDDLPLGVDAKQVIEKTSGKWIIEASELHGHKQREADHMKSFLSRRTDGPVRLAYDRTPTEVQRQFIIIGTTNTLTGYLKDFSGARRFWPVRVQAFDLDEIRQVRDQLWAEAAFREKNGESIRLDPSLYLLAEEEQESRRAMHPFEEVLTTSDEIHFDSDRIPVKKVWSALGVAANQRNNMHAQIITEIMQRYGYVRKIRLYPTDEEIAEDNDPKQRWYWVRAGVGEIGAE